MKRSSLLLLSVALAWVPVRSARAAEAAGEGGHANMDLWKWANFLVLAGGLGYLAGKKSGPFFAARSSQIRDDIAKAEEQRKEAEARASAVEGRLANLEAELAALREESAREQETQISRIRRQTGVQISKIEAHAGQELEAAGKTARHELKRYAAELAVELAEQRIRTRMNPEVQESLVRGFAADLQSASRGQTE